MLNRRHFLLRTGAVGAGLAVGLPTRANPGADGLSSAAAYVNHLTPDALRAAERGLAFLANTQNRDGSFGDSLLFQGNLAVTSLAALALMAGGHTPGRGLHCNAVMRALQFVLSKEQRDPPGFLNFPNGHFRQGPMYSHGFATLFLAEAFGMVADKTLSDRLKTTIERAVQLIITCQNSEGGWRYNPQKETADSSVTICQIMALRAARNAGFFVPKEAADKCVKYVRSCQTADGGFSYFSGQPGAAFPRSAAGIVALYCAGVYTGPEVERGLKYLMKFKPGGNMGRSGFFPDQHYYYGQYYAAQAMWTAGPKYWDEWFPGIRDELLRLNRGRGDGSWSDPTVCNHYATAMACIILQIPNNYLPILQK
ncbi:MAG TPA: prenyltransferase/squalene oxidase repeat-containing protein [Gemmataceae bacterium]|nr:prenyltransferase/squalene oxidase repeat-containing protein [Gemmataceae bacterium]